MELLSDFTLGKVKAAEEGCAQIWERGELKLAS